MKGSAIAGSSALARTQLIRPQDRWRRSARICGPVSPPTPARWSDCATRSCFALASACLEGSLRLCLCISGRRVPLASLACARCRPSTAAVLGRRDTARLRLCSAADSRLSAACHNMGNAQSDEVRAGVSALGSPVQGSAPRKARADEQRAPSEQARAAARQRAFAEQDASLRAIAANIQADTTALAANVGLRRPFLLTSRRSRTRTRSSGKCAC